MCIIYIKVYRGLIYIQFIHFKCMVWGDLATVSTVTTTTVKIEDISATIPKTVSVLLWTQSLTPPSLASG